MLFHNKNHNHNNTTIIRRNCAGNLFQRENNSRLINHFFYRSNRLSSALTIGSVIVTTAVASFYSPSFAYAWSNSIVAPRRNNRNSWISSSIHNNNNNNNNNNKKKKKKSVEHFMKRNVIRAMSSSTNNDNDVNMYDASCWKRARLSSSDDEDGVKDSQLVIATHSGTFQADEALGVWLLRQTEKYRNSKVIRTRDMEVLKSSSCDIVIDVGGEYDHSAFKYDHHQRGYEERFDPERCTKLSASGLVYRHYGKEVISAHYPNLPSPLVDLVYLKMYDRFMETIDAVDTGVEVAPELLYNAFATTLSCRVGRLNPRWNEPDDIDVDQRFEEASKMCGDEFLSVLIPLVESDLPAREHVQKAVHNRMETDPNRGRIICLSTGGLPWKNHLYDLEEELNLTDESNNNILFVLYTDQSGMWRVQAVSVKGQAFTNRLGLPEKWRGVRDDKLTDVAGIPGCRFCHAAGFIGGNDTYEGALKMAQTAIEQQHCQK